MTLAPVPEVTFGPYITPPRMPIYPATRGCTERSHCAGRRLYAAAPNDRSGARRGTDMDGCRRRAP
jgi:hypothetical protein